MSEASDIELLFAIWEQNVDTVRALNRSLKQEQLPKSGIAPQLVSHLKQCAIALVKPESRANGSDHHNATGTAAKAAPQDRQERLTFGEPKRIRSQGASPLRGKSALPHLRALALSRAPHTLRAIKGLSLKVSDEFTVPLCAIHHRQIHTTGKEREWWQEHNIDPLKIANGLWQQSRERYPAAGGAALPELPENGGGRGQSVHRGDGGSRP